MNVLVCGVGGQGVLLFSDLIAGVALDSGFDVKKSEVHGMAQRGGSVTSHIRYAPKVRSPLIEEGTADLLVAFEKLEALRYVHFLSPTGRLVYDPLRIEPLPVQLGLVRQLDDAELDRRLAARAARRMSVPAFELARELGSTRTQNVVMLGAVAGFLELPADDFRRAISTRLKPGLIELNLKAFESGQAAVARR